MILLIMDALSLHLISPLFLILKISQPLQDANLRLDFDFAVTTPMAINVIAYAAYDSELQITKDRDIITDAHS